MMQSISYLINQTHHVGISPASLVQIVGLLQHLGQLLTSNISVSLTPSLDGGGEEGVTHSEGGGDEYIGGGGVGANIVTIEISILEQNQIMLVHHFLAQHHWQELIVCDVLNQSSDNVTRFLRSVIVNILS